MNVSKELLEKAKTAKTVEELLAMAKEENINMTEKEATKIFADLHKNGELSDEELDNVTGGCGGRFTPSPDGKAGSEREVVFLYQIGQEVEIYTNYSGMSTRTKRHIVLERTISSDKNIWKELFNYPCTYWPSYYCQNLDDPSDKQWYSQYEIELP